MKKSKSEHLGTRIKKLRAINGMTQEELATAINKTRSMVSHIERTGEANYYTLKEIAQVLKVSVAKLEENSDELIYGRKVRIGEESILGVIPDEGMPARFLNDFSCHQDSQQELIKQLKEENTFLKNTIQNQWKLLLELAK